MIRFRKLDKYKYQLTESYKAIVPHARMAAANYLLLVTDVADDTSELHIDEGYAWNGANPPAINTLNFRRGSLVHDALYQLMRMGKIPFSYRDKADRLLQKICIEDGMWPIRAWWVYQAVSRFGANHAKPGTQEPVEIFTAPKGTTL